MNSVGTGFISTLLNPVSKTSKGTKIHLCLVNIFCHKLPCFALFWIILIGRFSSHFVLFFSNLRLYARGDSNPQPLAPEANAVRFTSHCFYCP